MILRNKLGRPGDHLLVTGLVLTVTLALGASTGCSDGRPERVKVSGRVLIDGKPMQYGIIQVLPQGNRASTGTIKEDGTFTLGCFEAEDGCIPGTHPIRVDGRQPMGLTKVKWFAPKRFANPGTAATEVTITEATDDLVIELQSGSSKAFEPYVEVLARGVTDEQIKAGDTAF